MNEKTDAIVNKYFAPSELANASAAIQAAQTVAGNLNVPVMTNFDPAQELPEGFGIAIRAVSKRGQENPLACLLLAIPSIELVATNPEGSKWLAELAINSMAEKAAATVRPRGDEPLLTDSSVMPRSLLDFVQPAKRGEGLGTFRAIAGDFVKVLKKKGLSFLNLSLLRQLLESAQFAKSQFPQIDQSKWVMVLDAMIAKAGKDALDTAILLHWRETRDAVEITMMDDFDLGDLA
jgi:hypothetical protein